METIEDVVQEEVEASPELDSSPENNNIPEQSEPEKKSPGPVPFNRFSAVNNEKNDYKAEAEALKAELEAAKEAKIRLADFEYDPEVDRKNQEEFQRKLVEKSINDYKAEEKAKQETEARRKQETEFNQSFENHYNNNPEAQKVYTEIIESGQPVTIPHNVGELIQGSEVGPQIELHILKNRHELLPKLQNMNPMQQAMEVGRIGAELASNPENNITQKRISNAPPPIDVNSGGGKEQSKQDVLKRRFPNLKLS